MKELVVDWETWDPYLKELGPGWVHGQMRLIGAAFKINDEKTIWKDFENEFESIKALASESDVIIAHNLQYDVGILLALGIDISDKVLIDTKQLAILFDNSMGDFSLDGLSKRFLGETKSNLPLALVAIRHRLFSRISKRKGPRSTTWKERKLKEAKKWAIENLHMIYEKRPDLVEKYCVQDVDLTYQLYDYLKSRVDKKWIYKCSEANHALLKMRRKGVKIDTDILIDVRQELYVKECEWLQKLQELAGNEEFNPNSPKDLPALYDKYGIWYPRTEKGNPSITKFWLEDQTDDISKVVKEYRRYSKARRDFCDSVIEGQMKMKNPGRVFPELKLFGAAATGRFSCANPNIQQIPARDDDIGPLIRSFYVPDDGEMWYCLDFSSQESRIQVHYANLTNCEGADEFVSAYKENPRLDLHTKVADIANIDRTTGKNINLRLSYGMGKAMLAKSLGLSDVDAKIVMDKYEDALPYLRELTLKCQSAMKKKGFIKTLSGRQLRLDSPTFENGVKRTYEYKAMNKLIQGSAADQCIEAIIQLDKAGITPLFVVHDECNFSLPADEWAEKARHIMENCVKLQVPMISDIGKGNNWSKAK